MRVRDVARVELDRQNYANFSFTHGRRAANIPIFLLPGANALQVADQVRQAMAAMSKDFPPGLAYEIRYDTTRFVRQAIRDVYQTLFEAALLVLVVIMVFLQDWRAMLVPATTVPVTIIGAFAAMAMLGFGINLMTLFALILAIGIVVDDAIIIVENASYYIDQGLKPKEATIKAMGEMVGPVVGITAVLTAVFLPAAFLPGITGQLFRQFALVIASTAVISAINALTLKPAQCALRLRLPAERRRPNAFYRGFNRVYGYLEGLYVRLITWMVGRPGAMAALFFVVVIAAGIGYAYHPTGFLPTEDQGYAVIITRLPEGSAQPRLLAAAKKLDAVLRNTRGIEAWVTIGGFSLIDNANLPNFATTFIVYQDWDQRGAALSQDRILAKLRSDLAAKIEEAQNLVVVPPPIRGLGQSGVPVDDRGPPEPGTPGIAENRLGSHACRRRAIGTAQRGDHLQRPQSPALPGHRPNQGGILGYSPHQCVPNPAVLPGLDLCQPVQQVQPGVPGLCTGRCPYRLTLRTSSGSTCATPVPKWCPSEPS